VGLIRDQDGVVHKDPHQEVRSRLELLFTTFLHLGSAAKVVQYFNEHHLDLPRRTQQGDLIWKKPASSIIITILKNPAYAGAFVYGRRKFVKQKADPQKKASKPLPIDQWKIIVKDKYPAYISWQTFEKIQAKLKDNYSEYARNKSRGIPRPGAALLHGIVYCGECGHKMIVQYKGWTSYICNTLRQEYQIPNCQVIPAKAVDDYVVANFFDALCPVEIDAYANALKKIRETRSQAQLAGKQQIQRLEYQANLVQRQFHQVDPDNRLVAAELESRWECALKALQQARQAYDKNKPIEDQLELPKEMIETFKSIGQQLPTIWEQSYLSSPIKKELLRCLISKVVIHRVKQDLLQVCIVWKGGATTSKRIPLKVGSFEHLSNAKQMEQQIVQLARKGISDRLIAQQLTEQGYRSPMNNVKVLSSTVTTIRLKHGIYKVACRSYPLCIDNYLSIPQLAKRLDVPKHWIYDRIYNHKIRLSKDPKTHAYLFLDTPETIEKLLNLKNGKVKTASF